MPFRAVVPLLCLCAVVPSLDIAVPSLRMPSLCRSRAAVCAVVVLCRRRAGVPSSRAVTPSCCGVVPSYRRRAVVVPLCNRAIICRRAVYMPSCSRDLSRRVRVPLGYTRRLNWWDVELVGLPEDLSVKLHRYGPRARSVDGKKAFWYITISEKT